MNFWVNFFYYSFVGAAFLLSLLGMWFSSIFPGLDRWSKRFFLSYFFVFLLCCFFSFMELVCYYYTVPRATYLFILVLESLFLSLPLPMLTVYLLHCCGEKIRQARLFFVVLGLWAVYSVLVVSSAFFDGVTYFTPDNHYYRGPLYSLVILPLVVIMLLNLAGSIRRRGQLSHKSFLSFLIALLPMTVTLTIHLFIDVFPLIDISFAFAALAMYSFVLSDQIERDRRHQQEIANQRASIMVLQMRPHFIYNTMTSIYCLCNQDPQLARQVVMDFTTYLRKNFNAIASSAPVPFTSELEHIHAYLAVEQALYEGSLSVDYDTPHTWFRVPPLTLQPLVENAVKHGRDPYAGPFHISIRTRKTDSGSEIVIADNGRGFDPAEDIETHTTLKNIRQRLEIMCGAHLTITPGDAGGTVVTVTIPDSAGQKESPEKNKLLQ